MSYNGKTIADFKMDSEYHFNTVAFSPDGKILASDGNEGTIRLWDLANGKNTATFKAGDSGNPVYSVAFRPDGKTLAAGCNMEGCELWDVATGKNVATYKPDSSDLKAYKNPNNMTWSVAFSPDGKTVATGCHNGLIRLLDVTSGKKIAALAGHTALVRSLAFSPDGKILASASDDSTVKLWDVDTKIIEAGARYPQQAEPNRKIERKPPAKELQKGFTVIDLNAEAGKATIPSDLKLRAESPQLLYLSWQKDGIHSTGQPIPHTLWDLDGNVLSDQLADEVLKKVGSFSVAWRREGELPPLVLVFKVDQRVTNCPVLPVIVTANGKISSGMTARSKPTNGMNVSAAAPQKDALPKWPTHISLEIKYPVENITTIKTLTDIPDDPVKIAPGVQWYLDSTRARDNREAEAKGKTAAVVQTSKDLADALVSYEVRVYLRGIAAPLSSAYKTIIEPNGKLHEIDVSQAFNGKNAIERVEITRQRYAVRRIDNVPVRVDLLPKTDGAKQP